MIELVELAAASDLNSVAASIGDRAVFVASPPQLDEDTTLAAQMIASARRFGLDEPTDLGDWAVDAFEAEALLDRVPKPMSRGERQLCVLLIALSRPFDALIVVDPTAGLDPRRRRIVADLLAELAEDHRVVCATDDPLVVERCA